MIQLSDTKAASVMGALLGHKPKAGGDSSAFALALGSLAADGVTGFAIATPRQAVAATGSDLPEDGREAGEENAPDIGLIFAVGATMPVAPPADDFNIAIEPESEPEPEPGSEPRPPVATAVDGPPLSPAPASTDVIPAGADVPLPIAASQNPLSADGTAAPPLAQRPIAAVDRPFTASAADSAPPPIEARPAAARGIDKITPGAPPLPTAVLPNAVLPNDADAPRTPGAHKPAAPSVSPGPAPVASQTGAPTIAAIPPGSSSPAPVPPIAPADRPSVSARLKPAAAPAARGTVPGAKPAAEPANAAAASTLAPRGEQAVPTPARFMPANSVPADRAPDAPVEVAPRRIAIAPVVPVATASAAMPMTVADLIPAQHRPRTGSPLVAPVVDPASVGLSAPVDGASRIAEPAPIDTHAADWMEAMIEQIDVMRDARADGASATTTRIRLSPDALGGIEIMLVGDGDAIDVRITADTPAARTLLAEAAPRLTDMAEARGLKLAQGDAGQPGQHQAQRQQQPDQPAANRRHAADPDRAASDLHERIA